MFRICKAYGVRKSNGKKKHRKRHDKTIRELAAAEVPVKRSEPD